jgi:trans-2,3-dihydro-3-hydroxyanthranilate isomerase
MARFTYYICDVFTEKRFGGTQLAVLPESTGLSDRQMQQIAREFNFPESTFVFPSDTHTRRVRIFSPTQEMPFAGHPNVGTAFVLASLGAFGPIGEDIITVVFDEKAGPVPLDIQKKNGFIWTELTAPQRVSLGQTASIEKVARALSLTAADIVTSTHPPRMATVGFPFLFVEVTNRKALERARAVVDGLEALMADGLPPDVHLYIRSGDEFDLRARMFAPMDGIPEDPATGSANVTLAAMLSHYHSARDGAFGFRIAQGVEMGRPSILHARTIKEDGVVVAAKIGGTSVMVSDGTIEVD